uniref:Tudor domain-containing protein n=1 Tax=Anopheles dirus TaxID=7168 RepID=A0A182N1E4_9DIPT
MENVRPHDINTPQKLRLVLQNARDALHVSRNRLQKLLSTNEDNYRTAKESAERHFRKLQRAVKSEEDEVMKRLVKLYKERSLVIKHDLGTLCETAKELGVLQREERNFNNSGQAKWLKLQMDSSAFFQNRPLNLSSEAENDRLAFVPKRHFSRTIKTTYELSAPIFPSIFLPLTGTNPSVADASTSTRASPEKRIRRQRFHERFSTVTVCYLKSPREFYVHDALTTDKLVERIGRLCQAEALAFEASLAAGISLPPAQVGLMCLVRPDDSTYWHRGLVLEQLVSAPDTCVWFVRFVDHGREQAVDATHVRPISVDLGQMMPAARRCELYNVAVPQAAQRDATREFLHWPANCSALMEAFIDKQQVLLYEVDDDGDTRTVDLFQPPVWKPPGRSAPLLQTHLDAYGVYPPMSLRATLMFHGHCEEPKHPAQHDSIKELERWHCQAAERALATYHLPPQPVPDAAAWENVLLTHVVSPSLLYLMPSAWKSAVFDRLNNLIQEDCSAGRARRVFQPHRGMLCAFTFEGGDGSRGSGRGIISTIRVGQCVLIVPDTGEQCTVPAANLRLLAPGSEAFRLHACAMLCRLGAVRPAQPLQTPGIWPQPALDVFLRVFRPDTERASAVPVQEPAEMAGLIGDAQAVILYAGGTCLNRVLVEAGQGLFVATDRLTDRALPSLPVEPAPGPLQRSATVQHVVNAQELYVRLSARAADLVKMQQELQDRTTEHTLLTQNEQADTGAWSVGDRCVCCDNDTFEWWRARIVAICEPNVMFRAYLVDRGDTREFHQRDVTSLEEEFQREPPFAIRCRLEGLQAPKAAVDAVLAAYTEHAVTLGVDPAGGDARAALPALSVVLWGRSGPRTPWVNFNAQLGRQFRTLAPGAAPGAAVLHTLDRAVEQWVEAERAANEKRTEDRGQADATKQQPAEDDDDEQEDSNGDVNLNRVQYIDPGSSTGSESSGSTIDSAQWRRLESSTPKYEMAPAAVASGTQLDIVARCFPATLAIAPGGFYANYTNHAADGTLYLYPQLEEHIRVTERLHQELQAAVADVPALLLWHASLLEPGEPCLVPYGRDGRYYRAVLTDACDARGRTGQPQLVRVLFVDYLHEETVCRSLVRKCPYQYRQQPLRNVVARLRGVRPNPRLVEQDVMERVVDCLRAAGTFYVWVEPGATEDRKLQVKLYRDPLMDGLLYQDLIDQGYLLADE